MKRLFYFLAIASLAFCFSCKDDDDTSQNSADLQYDLGINSAPIFGAGVHLAAARFTSSVTGSLAGQKLDRVEFYLINTPSNCKIRIFDEGTSSRPGDQLYEADVTNLVSPDSWTSHTLTEDLELANKDIWIAVEVTHPDERNTIGCDVGPANANGDWVLEGNEIEWQSYRDFTNDLVDINWNIRGYVE